MESLDAENRLLEQYANILELNAQRRELLELHRQQAEIQDIDPQTGLLNKSAFHRRVEEAVQDSEDDPNNPPVSVVLIDIDRFKDVNDILGHATGDTIIEAKGKLIGFLTGQLRTKQDDKHPDRALDTVSIDNSVYSQTTGEEPLPFEALAGHIGGDEFAILCHTDRDGAEKLVARLVEAFQRYINTPENQALKDLGIDISVGIGVHSPDQSSSAMMEAADIGMYEHKLSKLPMDEEKQAAVDRAVEDLTQVGIRRRDVAKYLTRMTFQ